METETVKGKVVSLLPDATGLERFNLFDAKAEL
jgi:hypothetical protein